MAGKLIFAYKTVGTNDLLFYQASWRKSIEPAGGIGLYRDGVAHIDRRGNQYYHEHYMNPPFVIHLLRACGYLATDVAFHFPFWLRAPSILADAGILFLLWKMVRPASPRAWLALIVAALSPVTFMISGFHGSTDSVVVFFLMLSVWLLRKPDRALAAGLAFGMSLNIKIWPAMLAPALLVWLPSWKERIRFSLASGAVLLIGSMPFLAQDPELVIRRLLGYPSVYGQWGTSRIVSVVAAWGNWNAASKLFESYGRFLMLAAVAGLGIWLQRRRQGSSIELRIALLTGVFLSLTPGFGVQYLAWLAPWVVLVGVEAVMAFSFAGGVFLYVVYNYWSMGQWVVADSYQRDPWSGVTILYELLCWLTVLLITWCFWRQLSQQIVPEPAPVPQGKPVAPGNQPRKRVRKK
jgi:hypothetical protein